jgi:hypothetical protein
MTRSIRHAATLALGLGLILSAPARARAEFRTATFEDLNPGTNAFSNNAGASGRFVSDGFGLNNVYDTTFPAFPTWSGWAISSRTDNALPAGFGNQYASVTGSGADGSSTYAVAYPFGPNADPLAPADSWIDLPTGYDPASIAVTNTAYAYSVITLGDPNNFARKFDTGDYFRLNITGHTGLGGSGQAIDTIEFYLADFRNGLRFALSTWATVDLSGLAGRGVRSLRFGLESTDAGLFGINTPTYFAIDNLRAGRDGGVQPVPEPGTLALAAAGLGLMGLASRARSRRRGA